MNYKRGGAGEANVASPAPARGATVAAQCAAVVELEHPEALPKGPLVFHWQTGKEAYNICIETIYA